MGCIDLKVESGLGVKQRERERMRERVVWFWGSLVCRWVLGFGGWCAAGVLALGAE